MTGDPDRRPQILWSRATDEGKNADEFINQSSGQSINCRYNISKLSWNIFRRFR